MSPSPARVGPRLVGHPGSRRPPEEAASLWPFEASVPWERKGRHESKGSPLFALSECPLQITPPLGDAMEDFGLSPCYGAPCLPLLKGRGGKRHNCYRHTSTISWVRVQSTTVKQVTHIFWFPNAYKSYVYTTLKSIKCA